MLNAIGFGSDQRRRSEQHVGRRRAAVTMGLPEALADRIAEMSEEARTNFGAEMLRHIDNVAVPGPEFPQRTSPNPERRAQRLVERARNDPPKIYEVKQRSVRTSDADAKAQARQYLADLYTNMAGEMICQACHREMPFRLADGSPYFEAPEYAYALSAEHPENHLALCPTCSAKWRHANDENPGTMVASLLASTNSELVVRLAGEEVTLRFVDVHVEDLTVISRSELEQLSAGEVRRPSPTGTMTIPDSSYDC